MKILWLTGLLKESLHMTTQLEMTNALRKKGHIVTLVMTRKVGEKKLENEEIIYLPTIYFRVISVVFFSFFTFFYLPIKIRKKKIDVIIIDETTVWLPFALTLKLLNIPLILDVRTLPIDKNTIKSLLYHIALTLSRYAVDGITTITPELEDCLRKTYNLQNKKIGIWTSGVNVHKFINPPVLVNENIISPSNSQTLSLMYHGTYSSTRGIENLVISIGELDASFRINVLVYFIGFSPKIKSKILKLGENIGVKEQIKFIPRVPYEEIPSYISRVDIGVYPLPPENKWWWVSAPLKTLEYLAAGKPIIVTDIPFHRRIFNNGECGVLIETNTPNDIAKAITRLYKNKEKLVEFGKKGREIVEKYHTWDHEALNLERFLDKIVGCNRK